MDLAEFQHNRASVPQALLARYAGSWVAFSSDGRNILAAAAALDELEEELAARGQNPQQVFLERITGPDDDNLLGGGDLL